MRAVADQNVPLVEPVIENKTYNPKLQQEKEIVRGFMLSPVFGGVYLKLVVFLYQGKEPIYSDRRA